jgi:ribonuclease R
VTTKNSASASTSAPVGKHQGIISVSSKGVGYLEIPDLSEDIEIQAEHLNTALNKDEVEAVLIPGVIRGRRQGKVLKVTKRAKESFVGVLEKTDSKLLLVPDDKRFYTKIHIAAPAPAGSEPGMKALVHLDAWNDPKVLPTGTIDRVIGRKGEHNAEMASIVLERGIDTDYPAAVEKEAEEIERTQKPIPAAELAKRRDFRETLTMTIDPVDAKDFDDAISFAPLGDGWYEVGVHIADVSHYVREGTALDAEARKRGFSVYLVDRTIPMLPEVLSNDICSLNPNEDKLVFSAVFEINAKAEIRSRWFGKAVIRSAKRFSYEEAQGSLDDEKKPYHHELTTLNGMAKIMRAAKWKKGAIDFEQDEIRFELDPISGKPLKIYKKERLDTHKLVEEYMLLANREVAEYMWKAFEKKAFKSPFIYRIHDTPDRDRIAELALFVKALGYTLPLTPKGSVTAQDLQALFKQIAGKAEEGMIKTAAVRSMAKAVYTTKNIGHFGLAFEYYTHFTSPIRRYADLLVHRVLFKHLSGEPVGEEEWVRYEKMAAENTEREIAAAEAERASKKYKQVEYMLDHVGEIFDGVISGVTEWGIYVEETHTRAEGMVKLRDLPGNDFYALDPKTYSVVGERTKRRFTLGDKVRFKITAADMERKTLDMTLIENVPRK